MGPQRDDDIGLFHQTLGMFQIAYQKWVLRAYIQKKTQPTDEASRFPIHSFNPVVTQMALVKLSGSQV